MRRFTVDSREADPLWQGPAVSLTGALFLAGTVAWIVYRVWPALFLPWWFNTDEIVSYYEVIRQLRLDPSQTFFDIPGTPYITLTSMTTALWWAVDHIPGFATGMNPSDFAFAHIQGVILLMRCVTLTLYVGSVALLYDIVRRSSGAITAVMTAVAFATLPVHVQYSFFARTESLGNVLCLGAIWIVLFSRRRSSPRGYGIAGLLAGAAAAARYHFALAGLPVLIALVFLKDRAPSTLSDETETTGYRVLYRIAGLGCALAMGGALVALLVKANPARGGNWLTDAMLLTTRAGPGQYAGAKETMARLWILLGIAGGAALTFFRFRRRWAWARGLFQPSFVFLLLGFALGFLLTHPEFLWRGEYQLRSMQFYADWIDPNLLGLTVMGRWWAVVNFYFSTALPGIARIAFAGGVVFILWKRQAVPLAFLAGSCVFFFAHPLTMKMWQHHVIPWLPYLCFVPVAPATWIAEVAASRLTGARLERSTVAASLTVCASILMVLLATVRLPEEDHYYRISRDRTDQLSAKDRWMAQHIPAGSYRLESYYSLSGDGFYRWIEDVGVRVPAFVDRRRDLKIWWLGRGDVEGRAGYVCISRADISVFRADFERVHPGSTLNPFEDARFHSVARFGEGFYELQIFQFDLRGNGSHDAIP